MTGFLVAISVLLGLGSGLLLTMNVMRRGYDPLSLRNLFLVGYVYFFCVGTVLLVRGLHQGWFSLDSGYVPTDAGYLRLAYTSVLFVGAFLAASRVGFGWKWASRMIPRVPLSVSTPTLWSAIVPLLGISVVFSIVNPSSGYVGLLGSQLASGAGAAAFGLALYYALAQKLNPMAWGLAALTLVVGAVAATVGGSGRRFLLGMLLVGPWVLYFAKWRYLRPMRLAIPGGIGAAAALFFMLAYSGYRGEQDRDAASRLRQLVSVVTNPVVSLNTLQYTLYTDTAYNSLFILENYPERFGYEPLHGAFWFVSNPIPRSVWPGKPAALGETLQNQMDTEANLGPGIIGHGWSEAGVIGVVYYAVFFGLLLGVMDRGLAERATDPFFVVMLGSNLGNMIAMPRGDTPLFFIQWVASIVAVVGVLVGVRLLIEPIGRAFPSIRIWPPGMGPAPAGTESGAASGGAFAPDVAHADAA